MSERVANCSGDLVSIWLQSSDKKNEDNYKRENPNVWE
jgi:hypothetical protein